MNELNLPALQSLCKEYGRTMDSDGNIFLLKNGIASKVAYAKIKTGKKPRFQVFDTSGNMLVSFPPEKQTECLKVILEQYWFAKKAVIDPNQDVNNQGFINVEFNS